MWRSCMQLASSVIATISSFGLRDTGFNIHPINRETNLQRIKRPQQCSEFLRGIPLEAYWVVIALAFRSDGHARIRRRIGGAERTSCRTWTYPWSGWIDGPSVFGARSRIRWVGGRFGGRTLNRCSQPITPCSHPKCSSRCLWWGWKARACCP
jgi:hypothetical protein